MMHNFGINITLAIILLGGIFTACSKDTGMLAIYEINGTVTDSVTNTPLNRIRIIRKGTDYLLFNDTTFTDVNGKYSFLLTDYYSKNASFSLKIEDTDGLLNGGEYKPHNVELKFSANDWAFSGVPKEYEGMATTTTDIKLQKK
ncbi:MAG: radical SAM-associated putative lipoprotein [Paludibacter sp.]